MSRISKYLVLSFLSFWVMAIVCGATDGEKLDNEELEKLLRRQMWDEASNQISKMEKAGLCNGAVCLSANALILNANGKALEAQEMARHAIEKLSEGQDLSAWQYNALGALLYRGAKGKREDLQLAEAAFRRAAATYKGKASNIMFNLATVLTELGDKDEAKKLMDKMEAEGGILVDASMEILGDLKLPILQ